MSNLENLRPVWHPYINQVEPGEHIEGGPDGVANKATRQLAERTEFLRQYVRDSISDIEITLDAEEKQSIISDVETKLSEIRDIIANMKDLDQAEVERIAREVRKDVADAFAAGENISQAARELREQLAGRIDVEVANALETFEVDIDQLTVNDKASEQELIDFLGDKYEATGPDGLIKQSLVFAGRVRKTLVDADKALVTDMNIMRAQLGSEYEAFYTFHFDEDTNEWLNGEHVVDPLYPVGELKVRNTAVISPPITANKVEVNFDEEGNPVETSEVIGLNGTKYPLLKIRLRKVGQPIWKGELRWNEMTEAEQLFIDEPAVWSADNTDQSKALEPHTITLKLHEEWTGLTIDSIMLDLSDDATVDDYYLIDWVSFGRQAPGSSIANIIETKTVDATKDRIIASRLTGIEAEMQFATGEGGASFGEWIQAKVGPDGSLTEMSNNIDAFFNTVGGVETAAGIINDAYTKADGEAAELRITQAAEAKYEQYDAENALILAAQVQYNAQVEGYANEVAAQSTLIEEMDVRYGDNIAGYVTKVDAFADDMTGVVSKVDGIEVRVDDNEAYIDELKTVSIDGNVGIIESVETLGFEISGTDGQGGIKGQLTNAFELIGDADAGTGLASKVENLIIAFEGSGDPDDPDGTLLGRISRVERIQKDNETEFASRLETLELKNNQYDASIDSLEEIVNLGDGTILAQRFEEVAIETQAVAGNVTSLEQVVVENNTVTAEALTQLQSATENTAGAVTTLEQTTSDLTSSLAESTKNLTAKFDLLKDVDTMAGYTSEPEYYRSKAYEVDNYFGNKGEQLDPTELDYKRLTRELRLHTDIGLPKHVGYTVYVETTVPDPIKVPRGLDEDGNDLGFDFTTDMSKPVTQLVFTQDGRIFTRDSYQGSTAEQNEFETWEEQWTQIMDVSEYESRIEFAQTVLSENIGKSLSAAEISTKVTATAESIVAEHIEVLESTFDDNYIKTGFMQTQSADAHSVQGAIESFIEAEFEADEFGRPRGATAKRLESAWASDVESVSEVLTTLTANHGSQSATLTERAQIMADETHSISSKMTELTSVFGGDGEMAPVVAKLSSMAEALTDASGSIVNVTDTIETSFSNIRIGGRNLLRNSDFKNDAELPTVFGGVTTYSNRDDTNYLRAEYQASFNANFYLSFSKTPIKVEAGKEYTLSFLGYSSSTELFDYTWIIYPSKPIGTPNQRITALLSNTNYGDRHESSITFTADQTATDAYIYIGIDRASNENKVGDWFEIAELQLEEGNIRTAWNPAPEDFSNAIGANSTSIKNSVQALNDEDKALGRRIGEIRTEYGPAVAKISDIAEALSDGSGAYVKVGQAIEASFNDLIIGARNILRKDNIEAHGATTINDKGVARLSYRPGTNAWLRFKVADLVGIEVGLEYVLSFKTRKISGSLSSFGGHTTPLTHLYTRRDGVKVGGPFSSWIDTYPNDTDIHHYEVGFKATDTSGILYIQPGRPSYNVTGVLDVWDIKIERGSKATDWTPAPEDVDGAIHANNARIEHEANVASTATNAVGKRVDSIRTEYGPAVAKISRIENALSDGKGSYVNVTNAIKASFDSIEIGSTNLYRNGQWDYGWTSWNTNTEIKKLKIFNVPHLEAKCLTANATFGFTTKGTDLMDMPLINGHTYTLSWNGIGNGVTELDYLYIMRRDGNNSQLPTTPISTSSSAHRHSVTFKAPWTTEQGYILFATRNVGVGAYFRIADVKLEKGNMSTEWSPCPRDTSNELSAITSEIDRVDKVTATNAGAIAETRTQLTAKFNNSVGRNLLDNSNMAHNAGVLHNTGVLQTMNAHMRSRSIWLYTTEPTQYTFTDYGGNTRNFRWAAFKAGSAYITGGFVALNNFIETDEGWLTTTFTVPTGTHRIYLSSEARVNDGWERYFKLELGDTPTGYSDFGGNAVKDSVETHARITSTAKTLADDIGSVAEKVDTLETQSTNNTALHYFDMNADYKKWKNYSGGGPIFASTAGVGVGALNSTANNQAWLIREENIPLKKGAIYRITSRYWKREGTGTTYVGVAGVAANGTTLVNTSGANSSSQQSYIDSNSRTGWQEIHGYIAADGTNTQGLSGVKILHANAKFFRPLLIANYSGQPGVTYFEYFRVEIVDNVNTANITASMKTVDGIKAEAKVLTTVGNKISGWKNLNNGTTSSFDILADNFSVGNAGVMKKPFSIVGNDITFNGKVSFNSMTGTVSSSQIPTGTINLNHMVTADRNKINTASTTAASALSNAATAQTKANQAATAAATADSKAVTATTNANTAKTFATTEANRVLGLAKTDATTKANNAKTTAETYAKAQADAAKVHADLKDKVLVIDSRTKKFISPASYTEHASAVTGYLIIETPITASKMVKLNITGYNYQEGKTNLDLAVGFYMTSSITRYDYADTGTYPIGNVRLGIKGGKAVVIIGNANSTWSYPKIEVVQAIIGHQNPPDSWKDGWTIRYSTSIADITGVKVINNNNSTSLKSLQDNVYVPGTTDINGANIRTGTITAASGAIGDLAVTTAKINNLAVSTGKIANLAVSTGKIANLAVSTAKIANLAVKSAQIDNLAVTTGKIANLSVDTLKIKDNAVTVPRLKYLAPGVASFKFPQDKVGTFVKFHELDRVSLSSFSGAVSIRVIIDRISAHTNAFSHTITNFDIVIRTGDGQELARRRVFNELSAFFKPDATSYICLPEVLLEFGSATNLTVVTGFSYTHRYSGSATSTTNTGVAVGAMSIAVTGVKK